MMLLTEYSHTLLIVEDYLFKNKKTQACFCLFAFVKYLCKYKLVTFYALLSKILFTPLNLMYLSFRWIDSMIM